ncbi:PAS domain S-box protein [Hyphomonas sp.]|uniref:PAS domain S-box protein n=1 Tax=Hyphomonas sp. TaxID=87 RepID=UPI0035298D61
MNRATAKRIDDSSLPPLEGEGAINPLAPGAVGIAHIGPDGTILRCNRQFADMLGYTPKELAGMHMDSVTDTDDIEPQTMLFQEVVAGKRRSFQMKKRYVHKDGKIVWAILTVGFLREADGRGGHFVAINNDVTEKQITSEALAESEARFRATFENAAVGMALVGTDGSWLRVNQRVCDIVGYEPQELMQLTFQDITHPDDLDIDLGLLQETIEGKRDSYSMDKRYLRKDGSLVWVKLTVGCVRNGAGEVDYFISVIEDITAEKRKDEALHRSEGRFRAAFENAAIGMVQVNLDGKWLNMNRYIYKMFGYSEDDPWEPTYQNVTHPDDLHIGLEEVKEMIAGTRDSVQVEKRFLRKDGGVVYANLSASCVRNSEGKVDYAISVIEDITEKRQIHRDLAVSESRFMAVQQTMPDGFMMFRSIRNKDGGLEDFYCEYGNPAAQKILAIGPEEIPGYKMLERDANSVELGLFDLYRGVVETGETAQGELKFPFRNGDIRWFRYSVVKVNDGFAVAFSDVSDTKVAELQLRESEERFRAAQQTTPDGFLMFSAVYDDDGEIADFVCEYANPAAHIIADREGREMVGNTMLTNTPATKDHPVFQAYSRVVETGEPLEAEMLFPITDEGKWLRVAAVKIEKGVAVTFSDITERKKSELKLKESEERFRAAQQTTPDGFMMFRTIYDDDDNVVDFMCEYENPAAAAIIDRGGEVLVGKTILNDAPPDMKIPLFETYRTLVANDEPLDTEMFFPVTKGGIWLRIAAVKIEKGFAVTYSDITARKESELKLKESESRLRAFHQTAPDGFTIFRSIRNSAGAITDFRFVYANPAAQKASGMSEEELYQTTMLAEGPALKPAGVFEKYIDVVESGKPWQGEFFYPGERRPAWYDVTAAKVDDGIAISYKDISNQKEAEVKLREQEERNRDILDNLISFVTLLTPDGIIIDVNAAALATAKLTASDVVGKHFWDTYWWSHDADAREELRRCVLQAAKGERVRHDTTVRILGDERIAVANLLAPVLDKDGVVTSVVASGFDISDRKKAEQHREMLVGELSHRVKNSLATVQTIASHSLREASDLESFRETFVGRLMAISKCHDLLIETTRNAADISQLVRDQVLPYAQGGIDRQVTMSGPPLMLGPEAAHTFGLILHELATNAAKYGALSTEQGRLDISWKRGSHLQQRDAILTWVERGGPPVEPPKRRGFGSVLIEQSLSHALGGEANIEYRPEGLWAQFRFRKRGQ